MRGGLARAAVFGASDGLVSNVSLLLGFAGSGVAVGVVRLAGLAGAVAGGISMAAGEWISVSSQNDLIQRELDVERRELRFNTEQETAELAAIYEGHGMGPEQAASAAEEVMRRPDVALIVHAREEFGVDPSDLPSPVSAAVVSLICFLFGAFLPVIPWLFLEGTEAAVASFAIGLLAAAVVGGLVGKFAERPLPVAIARQVLIVFVACTITYLLGEIADVSLD